MNTAHRSAFGVALLVLSSSLWAQSAVEQLLPAESFFAPAGDGPVDISPSGRFLAIAETGPDDRKHLKVIDLDGKEPPKIVAKFDRYDVTWFDWLGDDWLLYDTYNSKQDGVIVERSVMGAVSSDGKYFREVRGDSIAGYGPLGSNEIIFEEPHYTTRPIEFSHSTLYAKNIETGAYREILNGHTSPPGKIGEWIIDQKGNPRVALGAGPGGSRYVYWADPATGQWRRIGMLNPLDPEFEPLYVDDQDQLFVQVTNPSTDLAEIRRFDFSTNKPSSNAVLALTGFDAIATPIKDTGSDKVYGLRTLTDSASVAWFSPLMRDIQQKTDALLPGRVNVLSCRPCSAPKVVLIHSFADNTPGEYLLYRVAQEKFERIVQARPGHRTERMANMELYRTKTRDGADLPVWITKVEGPVKGPRPAIVLVHGGPWTRATSWAWDPEVQFLATRGYVVIEPEFRGSTGYGATHYRAGWKQWGQRMQEDVADSLKFAIGKGWVDPKRVCIAGGSYGGYSALMGLAKDPDLYKCAVAWLAVTDPRMMYTVFWSDISDGAKAVGMPHLIGDLEKDAAMLKANAPIELASKIKAPVFLAYGRRDRRVPIVHGETMRRELTWAGNKPEWVVYDAEGHGWRRPATKIDFWRRVEQFLAKQLK